MSWDKLKTCGGAFDILSSKPAQNRDRRTYSKYFYKTENKRKFRPRESQVYNNLRYRDSVSADKIKVDLWGLPGIKLPL